MDGLRVQSGTTPCFFRLHGWTIHESKMEQLFVFKTPRCYSPLVKSSGTVHESNPLGRSTSPILGDGPQVQSSVMVHESNPQELSTSPILGDGPRVQSWGRSTSVLRYSQICDRKFSAPSRGNFSGLWTWSKTPGA